MLPAFLVEARESFHGSVEASVEAIEAWKIPRFHAVEASMKAFKTFTASIVCMEASIASVSPMEALKAYTEAFMSFHAK